MILFCIGIFDGKAIETFYLNDFNNIEELIVNAFNYMLIPK
jgi:hypothetical protein